VDFLQSVVDRRTGNQVVLLDEVVPRETVKTSFRTPAFFCLLYLAGVFYTGLELSLAPHIG